MRGKRYIVIGDGAAGITAAQRLRELDPLGAITIVSDDPHPAYYRAALTNYLLGELTESQIWAVSPSYFYDYRLERVFGRVAGVDPTRSQVWLEQAPQPIDYDMLLVGSGASARPAPFPGAQLAGVTTLRTLQDARWVMDLVYRFGARRAVVVGGGPLALEWAMALKERGVEVALLVRDTRVLEQALDAEGSDLVLTRMKQAGIDVRARDEVAAVLPTPDGRVAAVQTTSGQVIPCQLLGVAIGVVPNTGFFQPGAVALSQRRALVVDDRMATSVGNVFGAGDVAELDGKLTQLWEPARRQAMVAAANIMGGNERYRPGVLYFATRLMDLDFASVGNVQGGPGFEEVVDRSQQQGRIAYRKLLIKDGRLAGALMLGQRETHVRSSGRVLKRLIDTALDISSIKAALLDPGFDLGGWIRRRALLRKPEPFAKQRPSNVPAPVAGSQEPAMATEAPRASVPAAAPTPRSPLSQVRGTQLVNLAAMTAAHGLVKVAATAKAMPDKAGVGAGQMLTIGLPMARMASVKITMGAAAALEGAGKRWPIDAAVASIGSDPRSEVVLDDPDVSHVHAQITRHGDDMFLRDVGSRVGTWVNGGRLTLPHRLKHGDRLRFGKVELQFVSASGN